MTLLHRHLSCEELVTLASDYLDGTLSPKQARAIEHHLADCPNCPNYVAQLRLTVRLTGELQIDAVPHELLDVLTRAWRDAHPDA